MPLAVRACCRLQCPSRKIVSTHNLVFLCCDIQVEDLSRQVAAAGKPGPVTVVHTGGDRGSAYLLYGCTAAGLGAVLYFRVLRGWTFGDMLYATRRGLRDGLAQVSTGGTLQGGCLHVNCGLLGAGCRCAGGLWMLGAEQDTSVH